MNEHYEEDNTMDNKEMKKLNNEEMDQAAGGNIIDDAMFNLTNLTNSIMTDVLQKQEKDNARSHNAAALREAAKENEIDQIDHYRYVWKKGIGWVK